MTSGADSDWTVQVVRTDANGNEIQGSARDLEPGDSIDIEAGPNEGIKVKRRGTPNGTAGGTYQKV